MEPTLGSGNRSMPSTLSTSARLLAITNLSISPSFLFVGQLREVTNKLHNAELKLFLEIELGPDRIPVSPPYNTKEDILLFFKLYDPEKEELRYMGRIFVKAVGRPLDILSKLNEMARFPPNEEIDLYEAQIEAVEEREKIQASLNGSNGITSLDDFEK